MRKNPYLVEGPALIQFSGGRTSGYMLHQILHAHGGRLPADVHVSFQNTGLEHPETYRFVQRVGEEWGVHIQWLEWRPSDPGFEEVGPNSADREGRWFAELIRERRFLPNAVTRFCTTVLKIRTATAWMRSQGYDEWISVVGIRADEQRRIAKGRARNAGGKDPFASCWPLNDAKVTKADVMAFWRQQPFDLNLPSESFGNCLLCHLKHRAKRIEVILAMPEAAEWPIAREAEISAMAAAGAVKTIEVETLFGTETLPAGPAAARFHKIGPSYAELAAYCRDYPLAAAREVAAYYDAIERGEDQADLLDSCMCGAGS